MKIAHVASDHNHISNAKNLFEQVALEKHDFFIKKTPPSIVENDMLNSMFRSNITKKYVFEEADIPDVIKRLCNYQLIIFHTLSDIHIKLINLLNDFNGVIMWKGWGYDYTDLLYDQFTDMLLPQSEKLYWQLKDSPNKDTPIAEITQQKKQAISRISLFCPVLEDEFNLIVQRHEFTRHMQFVEWRYGFEHDMQGLAKQSEKVCKVPSVWLGNSATVTNNHLDYLSLIEQTPEVQKLPHILPLSYGFENYRTEVINHFTNRNTLNNTQFLLDFEPFDSYGLRIASCSHLVMMHSRQQAMGNIWIGLLAGCEIYLLEGSPTLSFFKKNGFHVRSTHEFPDVELINKTKLNKKYISENITRTLVFFGDEQSENRSNILIQKVNTLLK
jgi:dTDP-N-acetylfucosamine:lipid II N-acetylfucosaminyltransferase